MDHLVSLRHFLYDYTWTGIRTGLDRLILDLAQSCLLVRQDLSDRELGGHIQNTDNTNSHGEIQKKLDLIANAYFLQCAEQHPHVLYYASEEMPTVLTTGTPHPKHPGFVLMTDPLDGSSNIDVNISVGSIFTVCAATPTAPAEAQCCQPAYSPLLAAYCLYGPATQLILSFGQGTHIFTLDLQSGLFYLTHKNVRIPPQTREFAINTANQRHWYPGIRRYIQDCCLGREGPRGHDFNMRWIASLVADAHRIFIRGGIFLYPADQRPTIQKGRLRLVYEAAPLAYLIEQAGGRAITDTGQDILSLSASSVHDKTPLILGSAQEIAHCMHYLSESTS